EEDAIHVKDGNGDTADRGTADDADPMPPEVASPAVAARVEERGQLFCDSVAAGDIRPLIRVAMKTAQSQVARNCRAVMLPGDDVIELERGREEGLRHQAIFAAASGTAPHQFDEPGV